MSFLKKTLNKGNAASITKMKVFEGYVIEKVLFFSFGNKIYVVVHFPFPLLLKPL